jgi:hypothetical protein
MTLVEHRRRITRACIRWVQLAVALALFSLAGAEAQACRCPPRDLATYFAAADVVMFARLTDIEAGDSEGEIALRFDLSQAPFKGSPTGLRYITGSSSASCGVPPLKGANYLIFARLDAPGDGPLRAIVNTCDGSRVFDPQHSGGTLPDFPDVPARFVVSQLTSLQAVAAASALADAHASPRLLGLLDLEPLSHGGHVDLLEAPRDDAPLARRITQIDQLPTREATYEFPAAQVMAREDGWYGLLMEDPAGKATDIRPPAASPAHDPALSATPRIGWMAADAAGTWWPLSKLLVNRLAYLTADWDGLLWSDAPGAGRVSRPPRSDETAVEVLGHTELAGSLWLNVVVLADSPCEVTKPRTVARGWIPAWATSGAPNAWFYSRGC